MVRVMVSCGERGPLRNLFEAKVATCWKVFRGTGAPFQRLLELHFSKGALGH